MSERAAPHYCPYCGDEDLRPAEATPGTWYCASCLRTFALKMIGVGVPEALPAGPAPTAPNSTGVSS